MRGCEPHHFSLSLTSDINLRAGDQACSEHGCGQTTTRPNHQREKGEKPSPAASSKAPFPPLMPLHAPLTSGFRIPVVVPSAPAQHQLHTSLETATPAKCLGERLRSIPTSLHVLTSPCPCACWRRLLSPKFLLPIGLLEQGATLSIPTSIPRWDMP